MRIGVVACSSRKREERSVAGDLYQGFLFRLSRRYVEQTCDGWVILSACYGVIRPDVPVDPYDRTLKTMTREERLRWETWCGQSLLNIWWTEMNAGGTFVVLAGVRYRNALRIHNLPYEAPLAGLGIGKQIQALQKMLKDIAGQQQEDR